MNIGINNIAQDSNGAQRWIEVGTTSNGEEIRRPVVVGEWSKVQDSSTPDVQTLTPLATFCQEIVFSAISGHSYTFADEERYGSLVLECSCGESTLTLPDLTTSTLLEVRQVVRVHKNAPIQRKKDTHGPE